MDLIQQSPSPILTVSARSFTVNSDRPRAVREEARGRDYVVRTDVTDDHDKKAHEILRDQARKIGS